MTVLVPNYAADAETFRDYVRKTSRPEALAKRLRIADELSDHMHTSARSLVRAVRGNSGDLKWVSQAMRDGRIVRSTSEPYHMTQGHLTEIHVEPIVRAFRDAMHEWCWQDGEDNPREPPAKVQAAWDAAADWLWNLDNPSTEAQGVVDGEETDE